LKGDPVQRLLRLENKSESSSLAWPVRDAGIIPTAGVIRTGQTTCWDGAGPINCLGTGQDGERRAGVAWPSPRFLNHGDGTVTDLLTHLMWTRNAYPASRTRSWSDALSDIRAYNASAYLGYTDWRLPNTEELASLLDYGAVLPSLPAGHPFTSIQSTYWTSTVHDAAYSWWLNFNDSYFYSEATSSKLNFWPVRGGAKPYVMGDAIVVLKILSKMDTPIPSRIKDIDGNGTIDLAEVIFILQTLMEAR
jgi:hypothetical protein